MKLYFKEKFFSLLGSYEIYDEDENVLYTAEGQLSLTSVVDIYDRDDNLEGTIKKVFLTFLPKYEFYHNGEYAGLLTKNFTLFKQSFDLDLHNWSVQGDFLNLEFEIEDECGNQIAYISRELFHMTQHYCLEVYDEGNVLDVLMIVLAICLEIKASAIASNNSAHVNSQ